MNKAVQVYEGKGKDPKLVDIEVTCWDCVLHHKDHGGPKYRPDCKKCAGKGEYVYCQVWSQ